MAAGRLVFGLLGPLDVWSDGTRLAITGTKRRVLLAHLLLRANQVVPADDLVEVMWPADPPRSARANIQTYVSALRRWLPDRPCGPRIATYGNGYLLEVARDELDVTRFEDLLLEAQHAQDHGQLDRALDLLDEALRLWRGEPLGDLPDCRSWRTAVDRLVELRLTAAEQRARNRIGRGQHAAAVGGLRALTEVHPFRESLWELLLTALHATGRRADALRAYGEIRELLVDELGVEPGRQLQSIHREILSGTFEAVPVTARGADTARSGVAAQPRMPVRQLPAGIPDFIGRANHLGALDELLAPREAQQHPAVAVIVGAPGTGKTTLAVHAARRACPSFPDGQLYIDMRGSTGTRSPTHVFREVLRALGVSGRAIPRRTAERATLYRSMLAQRRMLLVLDDAGDAQHVRDLLPPNGTCAMLVTSRRQLSTVPGAHAVHLDAFAAHEARQLLCSIAGAERVEREPQEATAICAACGYLPLAIRIAGAKLAERRFWSLRILAERLADESRRLGELHADDMWLRASFELSVRQLPADAATAFRLLGLLNTGSQPGWVIAALLGRDRADEVLDVLVDANLLQQLGPDASGQPRYRLHDLLHCYAVEAVAAEPAELRRQATARVLAGWLGLAERAGQLLSPCVFRPTPGQAPRWCPDPSGAARIVRAPLAWFDAERQHLVDMVELAAGTGLDELAWELAVALVPYFDQRSCYPDWRRSHSSALTVVRASGNRHGEAALLRGLGQVLLYQDCYVDALAMMRRSRSLSRQLGDQRGAAIAVTGLGSVHRIMGAHDLAVRCYQDALRELAAIGDEHSEAQVRNAMGIICRHRRDFGAARVWFDGALRLARRIGDRHREASIRGQIGMLQVDQARPHEALRSLHRAMVTFEALDDEHCAGYVLEAMGRAELLLDRPLRAQSSLDRALSIFRTTGDRRGQATATELLGKLHLTRHDIRAASSCHVDASQLWRQIGARPELPVATGAP